MESDVAKILTRIGPALSSDIVRLLVRSGVSRAAARKRVSRASGQVRRLQGLQFPNRERFLFLEPQFGKRNFLDNLAAALRESGSSYGRALSGLESRGGVVPEAHFPVAAGLPVENAKGQIRASSVVDRLSQFRLVKRDETPNGPVLSLWDSPPFSTRRRATLIVEDVVLGAVKAWCAKLGWTSPKAVKIRSLDSAPDFGQFRFDLVGPCFLNAIVNYGSDGKLINGFIVADILLDREVTSNDIGPFFAKIGVLTNQKRSTRLQPMFIADRFTPDALNQLRKKGCFIAIPSTVFGDEVARQVLELITTIENAATAVSDDPARVFTLLGGIVKLEGAASNLRGVVLELIVAHLHKLRGYSIDIRKQVRSGQGELAEIDVLAQSRQELVCVECKGKSPGNLAGVLEIDDWLEKTIPRIESWLKGEDSIPQRRRFEFYSSTGYTKEACELISVVEKYHRKHRIRFFCGRDLISELRKENERALVNIFIEQFGQ